MPTSRTKPVRKAATGKPAAGKSATGKPAGKSATGKSAARKPAGKSATGKSAAGKSAAGKSAARKPAAGKSAARKPAARKSAAGKSAARKPAAGKSAAGKSAAGKSAARKPAAGKSAAGKSAARKPAAGKTAARKPAAGKTAARKPAAGKSVTRKPAAGKTATGKPAAGKSATRKPAAGKSAAGKSAARKPGVGKSAARQADPTSDFVLLGLPVEYAAFPDLPVYVARQELAALARTATANGRRLGKVGIDATQIETLGRFATRLGVTEKAWQEARAGVKLTAAERKLIAEADKLDGDLLAGGRWACRKDAEAQKELGLIAEGSGLTDTLEDLRDLVAFWQARGPELAQTEIKPADLLRAIALADQLTPIAERAAASENAAAALELRNRCFWAADELAKEIREAGRYVFRHDPKIASKFSSRYRTTAVRRTRQKQTEPTPPTPAPNDADSDTP